MFKNMAEKFKELVKERRENDSVQFDDPVAKITCWEPAKGGGMNFCSHRLFETRQDRFEFKPAMGARLFYLLFFFAGTGILTAVVYKIISGQAVFTKDNIVMTLVGLVFSSVGGVLYYLGTRPIVFDKQSGHFWKGSRDPNLEFNKNLIKVWTGLADIHALQILSERCRNKNSTYYSYELNLVLKDGQRINVVDHGNRKRICQDAERLAGFLQRPLWNTI